jgi:hypothetical protein
MKYQQKSSFSLRILISILISLILFTPPVFANPWIQMPDLESNRFFIQDKYLHTGFTVLNEGALAVNKNYVYIIHRTGEIQILNVESQKIIQAGTSIPFQDFEQREFGERGLPGVKGAFFDSLRKTLYVSSTIIRNKCAFMGVYSLPVLNFTTIDSAKLIFLTPTCAPIPVLDDTTGKITAAIRQEQPNISSAGGKIFVNDKGGLILTVGNFGDTWRSKKELDIQRANNNDLFGKIVELKLLGKNKFATHRVIATGFRNPSGLSVLKNSNRIIEVENAAEGGDELNEIIPNKNYGWPYVSLGHQYSGDDRKYSVGTFPPYEQALVYKDSKPPIYSWLPSIAPSNLVELPKSLSLNVSGVDELLMGTYKDRSLHLLLISGNSLISDERIYLGYRIRDLNFTLNKTLVILDDDGNIHQLSFKLRRN